MDNFIKPQSSVTYIDNFEDTSTVCTKEYVVGENAQLSYTGMCVGGTAKKDINLFFVLQCNASVVIELLVAHTNALIKVHCVMQGESSRAVVQGAYVLHESNVVRIATMQHHESANTVSKFVIKGIVEDNAQAAYSGMIRVERQARGCVSSQENKNILLSNSARALSVPSLEVLTDDVHCFHGSATARFDADHFFYALSRGIDEKSIRRLLVKAFFGDMFANKEVITLLERLL